MRQPDASGEDYDLYLGDCMDVMADMEDGSVDAVVTDPPYGVDYDGGAVNERKREKLQGDQDAEIYAGFIPLAQKVLREGGSGYIFYATSCSHDVYPVVNENFDHYQQLIWLKTNATFGNPFARYKFDFEPLIYCRKGSPSVWNGRSDQRATLRFRKDNDGIRFHPTAKPVPLIRHLISNSTNVGDTVLDPFMGSGTTGVACRQLDRKFIGIEINEEYFEIACERVGGPIQKELI